MPGGECLPQAPGATHEAAARTVTGAVTVTDTVTLCLLWMRCGSARWGMSSGMSNPVCCDSICTRCLCCASMRACKETREKETAKRQHLDQMLVLGWPQCAPARGKGGKRQTTTTRPQHQLMPGTPAEWHGRSAHALVMSRKSVQGR